MYDVIVVGAGAAGMMAAATAAKNGRRVLLMEKMEKAGRKIRISGKGRCNLTNARPRSSARRYAPMPTSSMWPSPNSTTKPPYVSSNVLA